MIIKKIHIQKFRGFNDVGLELWSHITAISWQNWTQKTTILGLISQPFSLNTLVEEKDPMSKEKPLSGGNFRSQFGEKFKRSKTFDKPGEHRWTVSFIDQKEPEYTVWSIDRGGKNIWEIRFWKVNKTTGNANKTKWSWFKRYPAIYLSLKRLYPIGEDSKIKEVDVQLPDDEKEFYAEWHNKILILTRDNEKILTPSIIKSNNKDTIGANTSYYDWLTNSAWQDNIWKILLAILSFKRLKEKYPNSYKGGILVIDELDATLYPGSQIKVIEFLHQMAEKYCIQIVFTTHSLTILEKIEEMKNKNKHNRNTIKSLFLEKVDNTINIKEKWFLYIKHKLEVSLSDAPRNIDKIDIYCEDKEWIILAKNFLWRAITKNLNFVQVSLGCENYLNLITHKIPAFLYPNSIIILDGDARQKIERKNEKNRKNIVCLPWDKSPERILAEFLNNLNDGDTFWDKGFSHQLCFRDHPFSEINSSRDKAKRRFNSEIIQSYYTQILKYWKKQHKDQVEEFKKSFMQIYSTIIREKWLSIPLWDTHEVKTS